MVYGTFDRLEVVDLAPTERSIVADEQWIYTKWIYFTIDVLYRFRYVEMLKKGMTQKKKKNNKESKYQHVPIPRIFPINNVNIELIYQQ